MKELTARQQALLDFLRKEQRRSGIMPTTREIQQHFGFASQTAAVDHLKALERKGHVRRLPGKARALVLRGGRSEDAFPGAGRVFHIPVFGLIPAGLAVESMQEQDETLPVALEGLGLSDQENAFALKVRGDSMTGAHILDGDLVILVRREPKAGDIVAALIDGETTLKRFMKEKGRSYLHAENAHYQDIHPVTDLAIQGVMVGLIRQARQ